jgi:uncharacterized protein (DUF433 family)
VDGAGDDLVFESDADDYYCGQSGSFFGAGAELAAAEEAGARIEWRAELKLSLEVRRIMAVLDWSQCPAVESNPDKLGGAWVLRGTRMPVSSIFENIEDGMSVAEVMEQFDVTREEIKSVLEFAARSLDVSVPVPPSRQAADARSV